MTKAEMEEHREGYYALLNRARAEIRMGQFDLAVRRSVDAWQYIDGMMQYERRFENKEFKSVEAIDIVLQYAPFLFDYDSLNSLEDFLKREKRIDKNTSDDLSARTAAAKSWMLKAQHMWDCLERKPGHSQNELRTTHGGHQDDWRTLAETWERMGLIRRTGEGDSSRLTLLSQFDEVVMAKCPACGVVARARKASFLAELTCPKCRTAIFFVILKETGVTSRKG